MILLDIIKLKMRMPRTLRLVAATGLGIAYVGAILMVFASPLPFPPLVLICPGLLIWQVADRRARKIERAGR